jgi:Flp pilus assembly protein TadG
MPVKAIFNRLRVAAGHFVHADRGNIAVIFGIAVVPILTFVGAAIDYSRATKARASMQSAIDSTALMLAKDLTDGTISSSDIQTKAREYFTALYNNKEAIISPESIQATYTAKDSSGASTILVTSSGSINTDFMKIVNIRTLDFKTTTRSKWGQSRMRVALALDVTGSMASDNKMPNLKTAATSMITTLSNLNKIDGDIYISLVPFSRDVNFGPANTTYVEWSNWEAEPASIKTTKPANWKNYGPSSVCPFSGRFGCVTSPSGPTATSTIPQTGSYSGYICPGLDSSTENYYNGCYTSVPLSTTTSHTFCSGKNSCACDYAHGAIGGMASDGYSCSCTGTKSSKSCTETLRDYDHSRWVFDHSTWNGCVVDRDQNNDTTNTAPKLGDLSTLFYAEQYAQCPQALTPLSNNWNTLKTNINNLSPNGNTNQAIGAAWGWFSLSQTAPLSAPAKDSGYNYEDYLVIVSDGMNTQDRWYSDQASIDNRQKILCDNLKKSPYNVKVFTIQINTSTTSPDPTSAVLQYCASGAGNFQMITSADQTAAAFENVTRQLSKLRISN